MLVKSNQMCLIATQTIVAMSLAFPAWAGGFPGGLRDALGPRYDAAPRIRAAPSRLPRPTTWVHHWNEIAIDASGLDHTPNAAFRHFRRPRKRTVRVASISVSTGHSTRPKASSRAGVSRITCSGMYSFR